MDEIYICKKCQWEGEGALLDFDVVEGCMGNDTVEVCPKCGSFEVAIQIRPSKYIEDNLNHLE